MDGSSSENDDFRPPGGFSSYSVGGDLPGSPGPAPGEPSDTMALAWDDDQQPQNQQFEASWGGNWHNYLEPPSEPLLKQTYLSPFLAGDLSSQPNPTACPFDPAASAIHRTPTISPLGLESTIRNQSRTFYPQLSRREEHNTPHLYTHDAKMGSSAETVDPTEEVLLQALETFSGMDPGRQRRLLEALRRRRCARNSPHSAGNHLIRPDAVNFPTGMTSGKVLKLTIWPTLSTGLDQGLQNVC